MKIVVGFLKTFSHRVIKVCIYHLLSKIGKDAARKKAAKASGVSLKIVKQGTCRYDYDHDDREGSYKVKFKKGNYRYEVEILAPTGAIMEFEKKYRK